MKNHKKRYTSNPYNKIIDISIVRFQLQNTFKSVTEGSMKNPTWCSVRYVWHVYVAHFKQSMKHRNQFSWIIGYMSWMLKYPASGWPSNKVKHCTWLNMEEIKSARVTESSSLQLLVDILRTSTKPETKWIISNKKFNLSSCRPAHPEVVYQQCPPYDFLLKD